MKDNFTDKSGVNYNHNRENISYVHILLVDDEDFLVRLWKNILEKRGYKVTSYTDGKLALNDFKNSPYSFDIVITDQSMPVITGKELSAEFFKIRNDIKIILCTGYSEEIEEENARDMGICEFLIKPFNNSDLVKAIEKIILK